MAEISSFQLETVHEFHPLVSAILNITPDHLNRHYTMDCYVQTKEKIAMNQKGSEVCVLNFDDDYLRSSGSIQQQRLCGFQDLQSRTEALIWKAI